MLVSAPMRALVFDGTAHLVTDYPDPQPGPGETRIRVRRAGICDTDLQLVQGYMGFSGVLGHEFVGEVESGPRAGERVVADINAGCGTCADCRERDGHHCATRTVLGIVARDGAFAERVCVPERCLVPVPDHVPDDAAVFAEPLAAGLHVLDVLPPDLADPIVVLGDGKLGLLTAFALRGAGHPVHLVGHHRGKLELAAASGATVALESEVADDLRSALVVEATGNPAGLSRALQIVRPRGTVVLKTTTAAPIELNLAPVVVHELSLVGSRCGDMRRAMAHLAAGRIDPTALVSARYPLARAEDALARAGSKGVLKVLLDM